MRIEADLNVCVGAGMCALIAPSVFDQNDVDGRVVPLTDSVDEDQLDLVRDAVLQCPSGALSLVDD